jgi:phage terminase large subunit-like protein
VGVDLRWRGRLFGALEEAGGLEAAELAEFLRGLTGPARTGLDDLWDWQAHRGQEEPDAADAGGPWRVWLVMAGRGFGKTRAGAEWVWARTREVPGAKIALVGGTIDEVLAVMVEGESGLIQAAGSGEEARWIASRRCVEFSNGAVGFAYSGERPDKLRGPEHHFAWCDELAKWTRGEAVWDNLQMTMRRGTRPRIMVTTTPKSVPALRKVLAAPGLAITGGASGENKHLPAAHLEAVVAMYGGTRLGRQELDGELIVDVAGALFPRALLEAGRVKAGTVAGNCPRIVIGVDPPASAEGDACGIVVCGLGADGIGYVLADCSVAGLSPEGWAQAVADAAAAWGADRVVAEKNQGGEMVESVLRAAEADLPLKLVHAAEAKGRRAEPVTTLFERGKAKLAGGFPELEDELAGMTIGGGYQGPGRSPDRADALVHAMAELMLAKPRGEPRLRML